MTPEEVESHLRQLCSHECDVLHFLFSDSSASAAAVASAAAAAAVEALAGGADSELLREREIARQGLASAARAGGPANIYRAFFLRVLAVPPNRCVLVCVLRCAVGPPVLVWGVRAACPFPPLLDPLLPLAHRFRPPSVMGDQKFEHTQNVTLQRILQACINLQSIHQDMAAAAAQQVCQ
jgi:hypothetical protein